MAIQNKNYKAIGNITIP